MFISSLHRLKLIALLLNKILQETGLKFAESSRSNSSISYPVETRRKILIVQIVSCVVNASVYKRKISVDLCIISMYIQNNAY